MPQTLYDVILTILERMIPVKFDRCFRSFLDGASISRQKLRELGNLDDVRAREFANWLQNQELLEDFRVFLSEYEGLEREVRLLLAGVKGKRDLYEPDVKMDESQVATIHFVNRTKEIDAIIRGVVSGVQRTTLISAPAGFGKSALLAEMGKTLSESDSRLAQKRYACALAKVDNTTSLLDLVAQISTELRLSKSATSGSTPGEELAIRWKSRYGKVSSSKSFTGIVLLIDYDSLPTKALFDALWSTFIKDVRKNLEDLSHPLEVHLIVAGRGLEILGLPYNALLMPLSPFTYQAVEDTAKRYLEGRGEQYIEQAAAHVLYLTGGHPQCMARLLLDFDLSNRLHENYFDPKSIKQLWQSHVRFAFEELERELHTRLPDFVEVVEALSVYRYPDYEVLQRHCDRYHPPGCETCDELAAKLSQTYLYTPDESIYLCDGLYRQLMTIKLRYENPERLRELCDIAALICLERIDQANEAWIWVLEYLFQRLQALTIAPLNEIEDRQQALQEYLRAEIPIVIAALYRRQAKWNEFRGLVALVTRYLGQQSETSTGMAHWEFVFLFNYLFREQKYDSSTIKLLSAALERERDLYKPTT